MSLNFGKHLVKKTLGRKGSKVISEKTEIDAAKKNTSFSKSLLSSTNMLLSSAISPKEETQSEKDEKILEKIMDKYSEEKNSQSLGIQDYCAANSQKEYSFLTELHNTCKELNDFIFTSPREESESCQLIEKEVLDELKDNNTKYKVQIALLTDKITKIKEKLFKTKGERNFVLQANEYQDAQERDNDKQYEITQQLFKECQEKNKELKFNLTAAKIQKDSLFKAVSYYIEKKDKDMAEEFRRIYGKYNNQTFVLVTQPVDKKDVDELFRKIAVLQKTVDNKNKIIKSLEKFTVPNKMRPITKRKSLIGKNTSMELK